VEEQAEAHGQTVSRENWSVVSMMHLAETEEQAVAEVQYGWDDFFGYNHIVNGGGFWTDDESLTPREQARRVYEAGSGIIGTPEMAVQQIQRLLDLSGGMGAFLFFANDWGNREATQRSYELFAREVMPHFDGSIAPRVNSYDWYIERRQAAVDTVGKGREQAEQSYQAEVQASRS
jgi:limonene 1,2-monooxygenase